MTPKQRRKALKLTQKDLAAKLGYSKSYITSVEVGRLPVTEELDFKLSIMEGGRSVVSKIISARIERLRAGMLQTANELLP